MLNKSEYRKGKSYGEIKIEEILKEIGLPYKDEYTFPDLTTKSGTPLRVDYCVFEEDGETILALIEYQ